MEGVDNTLEIGQERLALSTRHVLFVAGGAFDSLEGIVRSRLARLNVVGDWRDYLAAEDLVSSGMERQLIGRFPVRVVYDRLTTQDLQDILTKSADSPLHGLCPGPERLGHRAALHRRGPGGDRPAGQTGRHRGPGAHRHPAPGAPGGHVPAAGGLYRRAHDG